MNQMNNDNYINDEEEPVSSCCGAEIIFSDICKECKSHCSSMVLCQGCDGRGSIYVNEHQEEPCPNPNCKDGCVIL